MGEEAAYKVKTISFSGRRVSIMLQDANGPCPLLAIANVLLLRNQLQLPAGVGEVSQDRLVHMVAERLLDSNARSLEGAGLSEEQRASLAHNLSDAIALLPKLTTGIDVNLRFHDAQGFEYTPEVAVFDLLDIPLVHGWLVDPQDEETAHAVGSKSYNELVVLLVTALGSAATPKQLTPGVSFRSGDRQLSGEGLAAAGPAGGGGGDGGSQQDSDKASAAAAAVAQQQGQRIDADMLSSALRESLRLSVPAARDADAASSGPTSANFGAPTLGEASRAHSNLSMQTNDSMHSTVNRMMADLLSDTFTAANTPHSRGSGQAPFDGGARTGSGCDGGEEGEEATSALRPAFEPGSSAGSVSGQPSGVASPGAAAADEGEWWVEVRLSVDEAAAAAGGQAPVRVALVPHAAPPPPFDYGHIAGGGAAAAQRTTPATPHASMASMAPPEEPWRGGSGGAGTATPAAGGSGASGGGGDASPGEAAVREALLVQQFLDGHPSQLTYHGLVALQEGLRANQLAVFFRNNHFSTLFKGPEGQLYLLATDEGFQYEADVVWEHLASVDGDTSLVGGDFRPFQPHASQSDAAARQAAARDADWAAATAAAGGDTHDADLALAMQLQAEEEERVRAEQERRHAQAARQQEEQRRAALPQQQQQRVLPSQRRPSSGDSSGSAGGRRKKDKKSSGDSSCAIM